MIKEYEHEVKTIRGFSNWSDAEFSEELAPYEIFRAICDACGRNKYIKVFDNQGNEVLDE